uniref:TSP C-terminal domain-containing protein n=1 Tax=Ciona savignyi TaxID=51511 RepID=H2YAZ5_CIOSA
CLSSPCYTGVQCINVVIASNNTWDFQCSDCPVGYTGDGVTCSDIDECILSNPCVDQSQCINTMGGFYCDGCPPGYHSNPYFGFGLKDTNPVQMCTDVNECEQPGTCDPLVTCLNGQCPAGYAGPGSACGIDNDSDGQPDLFISCGDIVACAEDNCIGLPNSGQEDTDGDRRGDDCDSDDDNDFILDHLDNCPLVPNYVANGNQPDSDGDGFGDACDTCPHVFGQFLDTDGDGLGDSCDPDSDGDGVIDTSDVCPLDANITTSPDSDSDGVGDPCDNCPNVANTWQSDTNQNGVGNACDNGKDKDGDSVLDFMDNCPEVPNPSQSDWDGDGSGDACDMDTDNDGKPDEVDHCPFTFDPSVEDGVYSSCVNDFDEDGILDVEDTCISDPTISATSFLPYMEVNLHTGVPQPEWKISHKGRSVSQPISTPFPSMLIGPQRYGSMDFSGSIFVNEETTSGNYVGLVFGYHNNKKFYVILWSNSHESEDQAAEKTALKGLQIKVIDSSTGPHINLANAMWHTYDTTNQVKLIYHDPTLLGWNARTPYIIVLKHRCIIYLLHDYLDILFCINTLCFLIIGRPSVGSISVEITNLGNPIINTGPVYDTSYTGGRVGVISFRQSNVIWSNLKVKC